jgi:acylphosphatase
MDKVQLHVKLGGKVQGVGFRYFVRQKAAELAITGWVRNLKDGRVELLAEGARSDLERLLISAQQGPRGSQVEDVDASWEMANADLKGFEVKPTV